MLVSSTCRAALLCAVLIGISDAARADERIDLIFASDLAGDFHGQDCAEKTPRKGAGLASLASAIASAKKDSPQALVIGGGGLLGPASGARFLLHSVEGSRIAAQLVKSAGIDVVSPGVQDFEVGRETLLTYFEALREGGVAPLLSNLRCGKQDLALCKRLDGQQIISRGGLRIGLLGVVPEDAPQRVGPGHLHGAQIVPWRELVPVAKKLRPSVDVLIVEVDLSNRAGLDQALALARDLDAADAHVDLLHVTREGSPNGGVMSLQLTSGTLLVGTPAGGAGVTRVTVQTRPQEEVASDKPRRTLSAQRIAAPTEPPSGDLVQRLAVQRQLMCEGWEAPIATLPSGGLERAAVTRLVLSAMRSAGRAEIALINTGAIHDRGLPLRNATVHAVGNVLPFTARVLVATPTGQELSDALKKYADQGSPVPLRMDGLSQKDGNLLVNGRPLISTERYRVVTIDFVATGGNGLISDKLIPASRSAIVDEDLRHLVIEYLRQRGAADTATAPLILNDRPLWRANTDVGVDLQNVTVHNPGAVYDRPQLTRQPSLAFKFDATARAEMDQPRHLVQLTLRALYGQSWLRTAMPDEAPQWIGQETADLINLLALYSYRGFSATRPRLPTPYISLGLESEFNRPDTRAYHHFELSGATGMRVVLPARISANLGIGVRSELLASLASESESERDVARARFLVTTTLEMPKRALWPRLGNALLGEFSLNYNFTDPVQLRSHELRAIGKLYVELGRPLYLTVGTELYVYRDRENEAGVAIDVNAGLKVLLSGHRQQF